MISVSVEPENRTEEVKLVDSLIPEYGGNLFNIEEIRSLVHHLQREVGEGHLREGGTRVSHRAHREFAVPGR